jgi:phosphatidylglycerol:prolipoprotein diacylglycerol transferase
MGRCGRWVSDMHSELFSIGGLVIRGYGLMMALGFILGLVSWVRVGRGSGRDFTYCSDLLFWVMVSGIAGARAVYVLFEWDYYRKYPWLILRIDQGGLVFYGGFLFSALALMVFARRHRESLMSLLDFVITSVPLAHAFGRVGCFLNGCCFGRPHASPLGVRFPAGSPVAWYQMEIGLIPREAAATLPVHPVQLYEAALNVLLYGVVVWHYRRSRREGSTTALYLLAYAVIRFATETFRGDDRLRWQGLSVSQHVSIGLFLMGVMVLAWTRRAQQQQPHSASPRDPQTPASGSTAG